MSSKRILLVHHNPEEARELQNNLSRSLADHTIFVSTSGQEALNILMGSSSSHMGNYSRSNKIQPDIILLNHELPDMSGIEFLGIMRRYYSLKNIKVFVLVAPGYAVETAMLKKLGIEGLLEKPVDFRKTDSPAIAGLMSAMSSDSQKALLTLPAMFTFRDDPWGIVLRFIKGKSAVVSGSIGVKVVTCAVSVATIGAIANFSGKSVDNTFEKRNRNENMAVRAVELKAAPAAQVMPEAEEKAPPEIKKTTPKKKAAQPHVVIAPVPEENEPVANCSERTVQPVIRAEKDTGNTQ
jgi:CheY-like chemotaxis protein